MKVLLFSIFISLTILNCSSDEISYENYSSSSSFLIENPSSSAEIKRETEQACVINDTAGIRCTTDMVGTCKKAYPCTAVSSLGAEIYFSAAELSDWNNVDFSHNQDFMDHMVNIGWFYSAEELNSSLN